MNDILADMLRLLPYMAVIYAGVYVMFRIGKKQCSISHIVLSMLFTLGVAGIFAITGVTPMSGFHAEVRIEEVNIIPFYGIVDMLGSAIEDGHFEYAAINIIGNMILFMPFGFGLPLLWKEFYSLKRTVFAGFLVSLLIECSQFLLSRGTDVDDLLLNTLGTVFGYVLFVKLYAILPKLSRVSKERRTFSFEATATILLAYVSYFLLGLYHYKKFFA